MDIQELRKYWEEEIIPPAKKCVELIKERKIYGIASDEVVNRLNKVIHHVGNNLEKSILSFGDLYECSAILNDKTIHENIPKKEKDELMAFGKKLKKAEELVDELMKGDGFIVY